MLYLYAIVEPEAVVPVEGGVGRSLPMLVPLGRVAAVVGEVEGAVDPGDEEVLAHARVVDALADENEAVLPVRFGRGFRDEHELASAVAAIADDLAAQLGKVRGCVEIGLHVACPPQHVPTSETGRAYMEQRLSALTQAEAVALEIHTPLAEHSRASSRSRGVADTSPLRAAYLVPREEVDEFRRLVERVRARHPDLTFALTGPWPPYGFAALDEEHANA